MMRLPSSSKPIHPSRQQGSTRTTSTSPLPRTGSRFTRSSSRLSRAASSMAPATGGATRAVLGQLARALGAQVSHQRRLHALAHSARAGWRMRRRRITHAGEGNGWGPDRGRPCLLTHRFRLLPDWDASVCACAGSQCKRSQLARQLRLRREVLRAVWKSRIQRPWDGCADKGQVHRRTVYQQFRRCVPGDPAAAGTPRSPEWPM